MTNSLINISQPRRGVLQLQINRPKVLNALNTAVLNQLAERLDEASNDSSIRCVVLVGDDKAFAAGADIDELQQAVVGNFPEEQRQLAWKTLREFPKPIIAAVSGFALGGGCELMMVADIVVASKLAKFGQPEINLGILPGAGGTQRLTRVVGKTAAMKLNLTGEFIDAQEALRLGLITEVVEPELYLERAVALASNIANKSTQAAQAIKASVLDAYETGLKQGLLNERETFLKNLLSGDAAEGIDAFIGKRDPMFPSNA